MRSNERIQVVLSVMNERWVIQVPVDASGPAVDQIARAKLAAGRNAACSQYLTSP